MKELEDPKPLLKNADTGERDAVPTKASGSGKERTGVTALRRKPRDGEVGRKEKAERVKVELTVLNKASSGFTNGDAEDDHVAEGDVDGDAEEGIDADTLDEGARLEVGRCVPSME